MPLKRSIDGEREVKWVHRWPQVNQLLLSQVIDIKYGCFSFTFTFKGQPVVTGFCSAPDVKMHAAKWM